MDKALFCTNCGDTNNGKIVAKNSIQKKINALFIILAFLFFLISSMAFLGNPNNFNYTICIFLLYVIVYASNNINSNKYNLCKNCEKDTLIPLDSPVATYTLSKIKKISEIKE
ncbi:hypothetical protein AB834_02110 [PVC group bacterium (ex Bugula neritina AB1)]|nr:hypothetical protein AB834_02110 [PVC group bacterium (ex Bugula neritina AB1)]